MRQLFLAMDFHNAGFELADMPQLLQLLGYIQFLDTDDRDNLLSLLPLAEPFYAEFQETARRRIRIEYAEKKATTLKSQAQREMLSRAASPVQPGFDQELATVKRDLGLGEQDQPPDFAQLERELERELLRPNVSYMDFQNTLLGGKSSLFADVWRYFKSALVIESVDRTGKIFDVASLRRYCQNLLFETKDQDLEFVLEDELKISRRTRFELSQFLQALR